MSIYLIRAGKNGPVKIGKADDPKKRLSELQIAHWENLELTRLWRGGLAEEAMLHLRFADLHLRGDWFSFSRLMLGDVGLEQIKAPAFPGSRAMLPQASWNASLLDIEDRARDHGIRMARVFIESGVAPSTFTRWKNGTSQPNHKTLAKISGCVERLVMAQVSAA